MKSNSYYTLLVLRCVFSKEMVFAAQSPYSTLSVLGFHEPLIILPCVVLHRTASLNTLKRVHGSERNEAGGKDRGHKIQLLALMAVQSCIHIAVQN